MSEEKKTCEKRLIDGDWSYHSHPCGKTATLQHGGKWYCKRHHPPTVEARWRAKEVAWKTAYDAKCKATAEDGAARAEIERRAACYDDLLAALKDCINGVGCQPGYIRTQSISRAHAAVEKAEGR